MLQLSTGSIKSDSKTDMARCAEFVDKVDGCLDYDARGEKIPDTKVLFNLVGKHWTRTGGWELKPGKFKSETGYRLLTPRVIDCLHELPCIPTRCLGSQTAVVRLGTEVAG